MRALLCLLLAYSTAEAGPSAPPVADPVPPMAARTLSPGKLDAIRVFGRNVLSAKKSGEDDPADAKQLAQLRATVDQLMAVETPIGGPAAITIEEQGTRPRSQAGTAATPGRKAARRKARDMAGKLRYRANAMISSGKAATVRSGARSAGLPMGEQRGRLFERWADQLDAAVDDNNPQREASLRELKNALQSAERRGIEAPRTWGTPTLQAMPANTLSRMPAKKNQ